MNAHSKAIQIAAAAGKPENAAMIEAQFARKDILSKLSVADRIAVESPCHEPELVKAFEANRAAIKAANDEHADRVLARVKANAAKLMADLPNRVDEEPNHGPLWDDHDVAAVRAASWDGSL